jgi:hypothetical protein
MDIRYRPDHIYTEAQCKQIASQLNFAELNEDEDYRFTFIPKCTGSDCFKVAVYDQDKNFTAYW